MKIPSSILAGDSVSWRDVSGVDALGASVDSGLYACKYVFRGPQPAGNLDLALAAFGTGWQGTLTSAQTSAFNATALRQVWYWQAVATKLADASVVITLGRGQLIVEPSLLAASANQPFDGRSEAEQELAIVRAAIKAREQGDLVTKYTIGTRSLEKEPIDALLQLEQRCLRRVRAEQVRRRKANGQGNPGAVFARFTR